MKNNNIPSPILVDVPQGYEAQGRTEYGILDTDTRYLELSPQFTVRQEQEVEDESLLFGVSPTEDLGSFVQQHVRYYEETSKYLQDALPRVKTEVVDRMSAHLAAGDEGDAIALRGTMSRRLLSTTTVTLKDSLRYSVNSAGDFDSRTRQPALTLSDIVKTALNSAGQEDFCAKVETIVLAHEVMHGVLTTAIQDTFMGDSWNVRNGLKINDIDNPDDVFEYRGNLHGDWVNEAMIESLRNDIFGTDHVRYEPAVILLETLDEIDPGLRDALAISALEPRGPGHVFGRIENLLGPTGIEDAAEILANVRNFADFADFKKKVACLFPTDLRETALRILGEKELKHLGKREGYKAQMENLIDHKS